MCAGDSCVCCGGSTDLDLDSNMDLKNKSGFCLLFYFQIQIHFVCSKITHARLAVVMINANMFLMLDIRPTTLY